MADFLDLGRGMFINLDKVAMIRSNINGEDLDRVDVLSVGCVRIYFVGGHTGLTKTHLHEDQAKLFMAYMDQWKKT